MVITLTGSNSFQLAIALRELTQTFLTEVGDLGLEQLDGEETTLERIGEALTSLPFLSTTKMVIIRRGSANKGFADNIASLIEQLPDTTQVVLVEPKLDKRSGYYKFLKKSTDYREFTELDPGGLARWLSATATEMGGKISIGDASYLVTRVGQNHQLLAGELNKLLLYEKTVNRSSIDGLTEATPQSTVFELLDAAFNGSTAQALELYKQQRALKVEPQQIVAMLSWQLHILALIKTAGQRVPETLASEAKVSSYTVKKSLGIAKKITLAQLKQLIALLVDIDRRSKSETFDIDDALQLFILNLAHK